MVERNHSFLRMFVSVSILPIFTFSFARSFTSSDRVLTAFCELTCRLSKLFLSFKVFVHCLLPVVLSQRFKKIPRQGSLIMDTFPKVVGVLVTVAT